MCRRGEVILGKMFTTRSPSLFFEQYIINFPTKEHWRMPSRLCDIEAGLQDLRRVIASLSLRSIAIPALGCGRGGLAWGDHGARVTTGTTNTPSSRL